MPFTIVTNILIYTSFTTNEGMHIFVYAFKQKKDVSISTNISYL